jgi:DNA modification methylase
MKIIQMPLSDLVPYENNPRINDHAVDAVASSIREFGFKVPIIVDKENVIVAGHTRLKAVIRLGLDTVPVIIADDLTPEQVKAFRLADNKTAEMAYFDIGKLQIELAGIEDIDMAEFGFDLELDTLNLSSESEAEPEQDDIDVDKEKEAIEAAGETRTHTGDIWLLGQHRLLCGDSTSEADFDRLMDGARAQCAVTSPPYGVGKEYEKAGIEPWFETMRPAIKNICKNADIVCWNIGDLYPTGTQFIEPTAMYSIGLFADNGFRPIWIRIWKKQGMNFGNAPYHLVTNKPVQQYEYITALAAQETEEYNDQEFAWVSAFAGHSYKFVKRLTKDERKKWGYAGIWEISTVRANKDHPAMFPVELPWRCIKMHSDRGSIVLEPFAGCGTTLIACEQTERRCYAMEISPVYCDLIVKRWETFTGETAIKLEV